VNALRPRVARTPPWKGRLLGHERSRSPGSRRSCPPSQVAYATPWYSGQSTPIDPADRASYSGGAAPVFHRTSGRLRSCYWAKARRSGRARQAVPEVGIVNAAYIRIGVAFAADGYRLSPACCSACERIACGSLRPPSSQRSENVRRHEPSLARPTASNQTSCCPYTCSSSSG
jgi:hypothetical protein